MAINSQAGVEVPPGEIINLRTGLLYEDGSTATSTAHSHTGSSANVGSGNSHSNVSPSLICFVMIYASV